MKGYLFGDHKVFIDKRSHGLGGSWQGELRDGIPCAWDPESLEFFHNKMYQCGQGAVILDVGANTGSFCLLPAIKRGCFTVLAFEPQLEVWEVLKANVRLNKLQGIVLPYRGALSDSTDQMTMFLDKRPGHSGMATFHRDSVWVDPGEIKEMPETPIVFDDGFSLHNLHLVKVDTEGHDANVLRGMRRHLDKFSPGILFENWPKDPAMKYLTNIGYGNLQRVGRDNYFMERR